MYNHDLINAKQDACSQPSFFSDTSCRPTISTSHIPYIYKLSVGAGAGSADSVVTGIDGVSDAGADDGAEEAGAELLTAEEDSEAAGAELLADDVREETEDVTEESEEDVSEEEEELSSLLIEELDDVEEEVSSVTEESEEEDASEEVSLLASEDEEEEL